MKKKNNVITPYLEEVWQKISINPCPNSLYKYIYLFSEISKVYRNYTNYVFNSLKKPVFSIEDSLSELEQSLYWLVSKTNDVIEECKSSYILNRKERRILERLQKKNELIWFKFDERLRFVESGNNELYIEPESDFLAEEIPLKKDYSVILNDFNILLFHKN